MLKFYFNLAPNPTKVMLFLFETGLAFEPVPVDTKRGQQFEPSYLAINPNGKVPAIDDDGRVVFDSNAILLYLADRTGRFLADDRGALLSWLMFVASGVGPFSGQAVHFRHYTPQPVPYADTRYRFEALRHYRVADERLSARRYLAGDRYSIADMALWGWARLVPYVLGDDAWAGLPHLKRLVDEISARPAAQEVEAFKSRFSFKREMDDEARRHMFRHQREAA